MSMPRRKTLLSLLHRLSFEEKLIGISSLLTIFACFLPWYGITSRIMDQWWNGFSNIGYIVGYVIFVIALVSAYALIAPVFSLPVPRLLGHKLSHLVLHGEASFLLVLLSFVYARYTVFDAPGSSVRFGLYMALISSFIGAVSGYILWRKHIVDLRRKGLQEDFIHMPKIRNEFAEVEMEPEENDRFTANEQEEMLMPEESQEPKGLSSHEETAESDHVQEEAEETEEVLSQEPEQEIAKEKTVEELSQSYESGHRGLDSHHQEPKETQEADKDAMKFSF